MTKPVSSLLRWTALYQGEALYSLLFRLAQRNHYDPPELINYVCQDALKALGKKDNLQEPSQGETYCILSQLTKVDSLELYNSTSHRFARVLVWPNSAIESFNLQGGHAVERFPRLSARDQLRPFDAAQFCPTCIRESAYFRLIWTPISVAACIEHRCILVDRCPSCKRQVSIRAVLGQQCGSCHFDLTQVETIEIEQDALGLFSQQLLQSWLIPKPMIITPEYSPIPEADPQVLYRFLDGLQSAVSTSYSMWPFVHSIEQVIEAPEPLSEGIEARGKSSCYRAYREFATAFKGIINWPDGFKRFLREFRGRTPANRKNGLHADLGVIYSHWLNRYWKDPAFKFVQDAFDEYVADSYPFSRSIMRSVRYRKNPIAPERFAYLSNAQAARLLGTSSEMVTRLVDLGQLTIHVFGEDDLKLRGEELELESCVSRAEVLELKRKWDDTVTLDEAARLLGLSRDLVVDLTKIGLLVAARGPSVDGGDQWFYSKETISNALNMVGQNVFDGLVPPDVKIDLTMAAQKMTVVGLNAAGILKSVANGKIRAFRPFEKNEDLGALLFSESDLEMWVDTIRAGRRWIRREEIARKMGVKATIVSRWVNAGLLVPAAVCANARYFDRDDVAKFVSEHVFSEEAAKILGVGLLTVEKWARLRRLKPVSGPGIDECHRYLFKRKDVERFRPQERLTAPQLARRVGISRSQMSQLIRKGKVKPVSGPGIDHSKQYLFERSARDNSNNTDGE